MADKRRKDRDRVVLRKGESQRTNGSYMYRWTGRDGRRNCVYAPTLADLRLKEEEIKKDATQGIDYMGGLITLNELKDEWFKLKPKLKSRTREGYLVLYDRLIKDTIGDMVVRDIKYSDILKLYNDWAKDDRYSGSSIVRIHSILNQILQLAVDDEFIRVNPAKKAIADFRNTCDISREKVRGLTKAEQDALMNYLRNHRLYKRWYKLFLVILGTGMRFGEATALRWEWVDFENNEILVRKTLVYHDSVKGVKSYYSMEDPKTKASIREIPMMGFVRDVLKEEFDGQNETGIKSAMVIDGYDDFVFFNSLGTPHSVSTVNKALRYIVRDYNLEQENKGETMFLPHITTHMLRHSFVNRLVEADVNPKVAQEILGHTDITTTLNIYADVSRDVKKKTLDGVESCFI